MDASFLVFIITCILTVLAVCIKPTVRLGRFNFGTYWMVGLLGAVLMLVFGGLSFTEVAAGLTANTSVNPLKILALFLSMTLLSVFLDENGFFSFLAEKILTKNKGGKLRLFLVLYVTVSVLTVFTSNDIIILTFTPFLLYFCKNANIDPIPFLFSEFVAANTWSMALIIGNPTNIYLASYSGIGFFEYFSVMILPTLFGGLVSLLALYLVFKNRLTGDATFADRSGHPSEIKDKGLLIIGLVHLCLCIVFLALSSYIQIEMWLICVLLLGSEFVVSFLYLLFSKKPMHVLGATLLRAPYALIPFVLSMFVVVLGVGKSSIIGDAVSLLGKGNPVFTYGVSSFLTANVINNIPMSVLFSSLINGTKASVYASVVGSNLGALFTPIGALAGIMWCGLLKKFDVKMSFLTFMKYGVLLSVLPLLSTLGVLSLIV